MYKCFVDWNDVGIMEIISNYTELNKIKLQWKTGIEPVSMPPGIHKHHHRMIHHLHQYQKTNVV